MKAAWLVACFALAAFGAQAKLDCRPKDGTAPEAARGGVCGFDPSTRSYGGSPIEQARCLTRAVKPAGNIGAPTLSPSLERRVGKPAPEMVAVAAFLQHQGIAAGLVGGPMTQPITADYFIIHDTSSPNCSERGVQHSLCPELGMFPPNRDDVSWRENVDFGGHPRAAPNRSAHVFVNRVGASVTEVDLAESFATTKFELCKDADTKIGLFVGVENIQPRIGAPSVVPAGTKPNDRISPTPGFAPAQYERLALVYVVASARRGHWLVPAFHAVIDQLFHDAHDDPQNFEIGPFAEALERHASAISAGH